MDIEQLKERYGPFLKEHSLAVVLGILGFSLVGYGLIQLLVTRSDSSEITFQSAQQQLVSEKKTAQKAIIVDVEGAVLRPGIHKLPAESRVQDALIAAGGMSAHADRAKVSRGMNLAAKVVDGGKIYIPFEGESVSGSGEQGGTGGAGLEQGLLGSQTGLVNINTASETELDGLSGVGPSTAQKIIGARPYSSVEELLSKKAVGKSVFEKIREKVTVQ